jgi:hypothetical protein
MDWLTAVYNVGFDISSSKICILCYEMESFPAAVVVITVVVSVVVVVVAVVKGKFTLEQAMKAHMGSRFIALLFL